ncbi:unnamed protein product [Closterium sp. Yama58-4]|nr:unnamed protein product [Closterium sp. Yama58-4]
MRHSLPFRTLNPVARTPVAHTPDAHTPALTLMSLTIPSSQFRRLLTPASHELPSLNASRHSRTFVPRSPRSARYSLPLRSHCRPEFSPSSRKNDAIVLSPSLTQSRPSLIPVPLSHPSLSHTCSSLTPVPLSHPSLSHTRPSLIPVPLSHPSLSHTRPSLIPVPAAPRCHVASGVVTSPCIPLSASLVQALEAHPLLFLSAVLSPPSSSPLLLSLSAPLSHSPPFPLSPCPPFPLNPSPPFPHVLPSVSPLFISPFPHFPPFHLSLIPFPPLVLPSVSPLVLPSVSPLVLPSVSPLVLPSLSPMSFLAFSPLFLPPLRPCPSPSLTSPILPTCSAFRHWLRAMAARRIPATVAALAAATAAGFASAIAILVLSRPLHSLPAILHAFLLRVLRRISRTFLANCAGFKLLHNTRSVLSSSIEAPPVSSLPVSSDQNAPPASQCRLNLNGCNTDGFKNPPATDATGLAINRATLATCQEQGTSHKCDGPESATGIREIHEPSRKGRDGLVAAIGNTPLIRIASLSAATGCEIYGKAEFVNPGGSVKDRVALRIVQEALESGQLKPGGLITEGSAGSTGVALALVAAAFGCRCFVAMPDDAAVEKAEAMRALGAEVVRVRPVSITHPMHFVNVAQRRAEEEREGGEARRRAEEDEKGMRRGEEGEMDKRQGVAVGEEDAAVGEEDAAEWRGGEDGGLKRGGTTGGENVTSESSCSGSSVDRFDSVANHAVPCGSSSSSSSGGGGGGGGGGSGFFADQFENLANYRAHYCGTGPEIWRQTGGAVDAFLAAAGTGGTIAGISCYLKEQNPAVKVYLIDPPGSSLFHKVTRGVLYTRQEAEGKRLRNPFDTITEGIGINRLTANFNAARIDGAFRGTDREAVEMARFLLRSDGLFIGSSSAMNCVGAVRVAEQLGPGHTIVTILCDSGFRHLSKFHNEGYLRSQGLLPSATGLEFLGGRFAEQG